MSSHPNLKLPFPVHRWPSPHFSRGRAAEVDLVIVHFISLPPGVFGSGHVIDFFMGRLDPTLHPSYASIRDLKVSAHFFLERRGLIHQFVDTDDTAWHAGESEYEGRAHCNDFSVGIELEGDSRHAFTTEQYAVLTQLCAALMGRYPLIRPDRVVGHCHVSPGRKVDPGPKFDWEGFRRGLHKMIQS